MITGIGCKSVVIDIETMMYSKSWDLYVNINDGLVQERHNSIANALDYVFLALAHRWISARKT